MKLSERLRERNISVPVLEQAANLLDECETLIDAMRQEIQSLGGSLEGVTAADAIIAKLRAQENAD